jgi:hypothetical protein
MVNKQETRNVFLNPHAEGAQEEAVFLHTCECEECGTEAGTRETRFANGECVEEHYPCACGKEQMG